MNTIKTYPMPNSTILRLNSEKDEINTAPEYQRQGGVWNIEKKQLLIDSILNDYDIPKLYFHLLTSIQKAESNQNFDYAIIDGRQRIEAIWDFINGDFQLSDDFVYQADSNVNGAKLSYTDLAIEYPKIKIRFDSYVLPIVLVETEETELIEDMFSRLNEAVPLNGAEKRNAFGGNMARLIRETADHVFFTKKIKLSNSRYQHREVSARLLFIEYINLISPGKLIDTKKPYLDKMVRDLYDSTDVISQLSITIVPILDKMSEVFTNYDPLLRSQASIPVYYLVFKEAILKNKLSKITRGQLFQFIDLVSKNRVIAEGDITKANFEYLEFDRLNQQGTNDSYNIRERVKILSEFLGLQRD